MKALIQRVKKAWVECNGKRISSINTGLLILLGVKKDDTQQQAHRLAQRCANLRIFEDEKGKLNRSLLDVDGEALVVFQFTLLADTRKGNRPSFTNAEKPEKANSLYEDFVHSMKSTGINTQTGIFSAKMVVGIRNDGPLTIMVEV